MKIVDAFIFYNELKLLYFRLTELYDIVDHFVIVEATHSFAGNPKSLNFENNKQMFEKFLDKITYIVVEDMPNCGNAWINDWHQRNCIDRGISQLELNDEDLILLTDCDEIVKPQIIKGLKNKEVIIDDIIAIQMDMYYYNLTCKRKEYWYSSKVIPYFIYKVMPVPQLLITYSAVQLKHIKNGGWHFSYFGDVNFIKNKIKNFSHTEYNNPHYLDTDKLSDNIQNYKDPFNRPNEHFNKIAIEDNNNLPKNYKLLL